MTTNTIQPMLTLRQYIYSDKLIFTRRNCAGGGLPMETTSDQMSTTMPGTELTPKAPFGDQRGIRISGEV